MAHHATGRTMAVLDGEAGPRHEDDEARKPAQPPARHPPRRAPGRPGRRRRSSCCVLGSWGLQRSPSPTWWARPRPAAMQTLQGRRARVGTTTSQTSSATKGDVLRTDPAGGTSVKKGSTVDLVVSDGRPTSPSSPCRRSPANSWPRPSTTDGRRSGLHGEDITSSKAVGIVLDQSAGWRNQGAAERRSSSRCRANRARSPCRTCSARLPLRRPVLTTRGLTVGSSTNACSSQYRADWSRPVPAPAYRCSRAPPSTSSSPRAAVLRCRAWSVKRPARRRVSSRGPDWWPTPLRHRVRQRCPDRAMSIARTRRRAPGADRHDRQHLGLPVARHHHVVHDAPPRRRPPARRRRAARGTTALRPGSVLSPAQPSPAQPAQPSPVNPWSAPPAGPRSSPAAPDPTG